ncbi:MAG: GyrI-like domain-containing protein [FCB group bacterium]|nr:GyrI-like domain-containing protein [FCB group bacterium]MBL7027375.1 GyrI-like domain-containing protein [Candidatus Neomarinimicrobiota bacterium]MBL7122674.1 GyrI-like domain-containing protein [Candidatus Neomarinimicrobiota bacterium]
MKTKLALLLAIIILVGCGKKFEEYEYLSDPQISEKAPQKMLVYEAAGNPNETVGEAFGALISTFFKLKKTHDMDMVAPRARWPKSVDTPKDQWVGIYAMPVAETVAEIPAEILSEHPALKLETWEYGLVAEILHKGSYASEGPTVERLHQFISDSGYEISGLHEEEYLKGPGMFGPGNPDKYYTIIRYPVTKIDLPVEEPIIETSDMEETEG